MKSETALRIGDIICATGLHRRLQKA